MGLALKNEVGQALKEAESKDGDAQLRRWLSDALTSFPSRLCVPLITPSPSATLTVFSYNVCWESTKPKETGFGELGKAARSSPQVPRDNIKALIRRLQPDIVCLQEVCPEWGPELQAWLQEQLLVAPRKFYRGSPNFIGRSRWLNASMVGVS